MFSYFFDHRHICVNSLKDVHRDARQKLISFHVWMPLSTLQLLNMAGAWHLHTLLLHRIAIFMYEQSSLLLTSISEWGHHTQCLHIKCICIHVHTPHIMVRGTNTSHAFTLIHFLCRHIFAQKQLLLMESAMYIIIYASILQSNEIKTEMKWAWCVNMGKRRLNIKHCREYLLEACLETTTHTLE